MYRNACLTLLALAAVIVFGVFPAAAQVTTADVVGHVSDPKGLAVAGARVKVSSQATGFLRETSTSELGDFAVTLIPPGIYTISIGQQGFSTAVVDQVELVVGQKRTFDVTLKIGSSSQTVMVTDEAPLIETTSSEIQGSVSPLEVRELPVIDRNFAGLMTLVPGVRPAENFDPTKTRSGNVTVNGTDGRGIDYNVDGGDNKDNVIGGLVQNFTMEGIQEFNVVTDRYTAESGRAVGAVVNVISKSGTNQFHGTALGLFQNNGLNSARFDLPSSGPGNPPKFHRYQYGGSVGGPIKKDKLFFFGAFEQKREPGNLGVGTDAFTQLTALSSVPAAGLPTVTGPLAVPVTAVPFPYIDDLVTVKVDWKINNKQTAYARYGREKWTNPNDQLGNPVVTDQSQTNTDLNQFHSMVLSHNYVLSPNKINTVAFQFQDFVNAILPSPGRTFTVATASGVTTNPEICFLQATGCGGGAPEVEVGQNVNVPQQTLIRKYQVRDDFNWIVGRHNMKFGANYIYLAKLGGFFFFGANGYQVTFFDLPAGTFDPWRGC
jgi:Carboxypeptidase regulatory-like domain